LVKDLLKLRLLLNDEPVFHKNLFEIWCGRIEGGVRVCGILLFLDLQLHSMVQIVTTDNKSNDYEYSRETYYELIEKGKDALENMIEVARESEHPRAYEVLATMIKNVSDVNDRLMDLNKKQKDINKTDDVKQVENTQNNYFMGSTTDIQRMLRESEEVIDVEPNSVVSGKS